jgi:NADPH2:quinone reductase
MMKAIVVENYGGPEVLTVRELGKPVPGPGRLLIKLHRAGINPVDSYQCSGAQGYTPSLPFTPGIDGAGTVDDIGEGVIGFSVGMNVYIAGSLTGTYAEYCLCSPGQVFPLPVKLNMAEAACLGAPYFTAARALFTCARVSTGDIILIHGASGSVGLACMQLASDSSFKVFGTAGTKKGESLVRRNGAAACFDHHNPDRFKAIREATDGRGISLIIEMLANVNLDDDLKILAPGGRVVVVGSRGRIEISPRDLMSNENTVTGLKLAVATAEDRREYARRIEEGVEKGSLRPRIAAILSLEQAGDAQKMVMKGPHTGSIVLEINGKG